MKIKILWTLGIGIFLFVLLIIGGWAFMAGIGLLFVAAYSRNKNHGTLLAAATFLGLGLGMGLELALARVGGVAMLLGLALAYLGMAIFLWKSNQKISWGTGIFGTGLLLLTWGLWSTSLTDLSLYLTLFPFMILLLLALATFLYWRDRNQMTVDITKL